MSTTVFVPEGSQTGPGTSASYSTFDQSTILRVQVNTLVPPPSGGAVYIEDTLDGVNWNQLLSFGIGQGSPVRQVQNFNSVGSGNVSFGDTLRARWNINPVESATFSVVVNDKLISAPLQTRK